MAETTPKMGELLQYLIAHPLYNQGGPMQGNSTVGQAAGAAGSALSGMSPMLMKALASQNPGLSATKSGAQQLQMMPGQKGPSTGFFGINKVGFPAVPGGNAPLDPALSQRLMETY